MIKRKIWNLFCFSFLFMIHGTDKESSTLKNTTPYQNQELNQEVELNFNNASLQNIADQIAYIFNVTFLCDDVVKVPNSKIKPLSESKVSFKTHVPFTRKRAWDIFTIFLELAGWSLVPTNDPQIHRITEIDKANKSALPTFINISIDLLPKNNQRIRYVCLLENSTPEQMKPLIDKLKSQKAQVETFSTLRALIITDAAYNIHSLLQIIRELDRTTETQTLSVINLKEAEASEVVALIKTLQKKDSPSQAPWMPKQESTLYYFSKDVSLIPSPRTNSIILVGPKEGVKRIEKFILTHIDTELKQMYQPVHVYELNFAPAEQIATILNKVVSFGKERGGGGAQDQIQTVGETGGVLGGLKYFGDVFIEPEKQGNRLIIRSSQEDFEHLQGIIKQLDQRQPQVAIEIMIVQITLDRKRQWGIQWNSKNPRSLDMQLTGFFGSGARTTETGTPSANSNSLIANLLSLAKLPEAGTTLLTLGKENVYAILGMLDTNSQTRIIANPFIVATNKYRGAVSIIEERRAQSEQIQGVNQLSGNQSFEAKLEVGVTPQINTKGTINLEIDVIIESFTDPVEGTSASNANKKTSEVQTNANVSDKEVIALGGLIMKSKKFHKSKFPILSRIPIVGNLFKNESLETEDKSLIIFMSPTIIKPSEEITNRYTQNKAAFMEGISTAMKNRYETSERDPIYKWFFKPIDTDMSTDIENFLHKGTKRIEKIKKKQEQKSPHHNTIIKSVANEKEKVT